MTQALALFFLTTAALAAPIPAPSSLSGSLIVANGKTAAGSPLTENLTDAKATVIVFLSAVCPCSAAHEAALKKLYAEYAPKGLRFVAFHANQDESPSTAKSHFESASLPFPVLEDVGAKLADRLGALKTPHVFIASASGEILFSGGIDDSKNPANAKRFYLADALHAVSEGRVPEEKETRTLGCVIKR